MMRKAIVFGVVLGIALSMSGQVLAECVVCGGDGLCNSCNGLGFLMAKSYDSDEMIQIACMDENCNQGNCSACEKEAKKDTDDSEIDQMIQQAQELYAAKEYESAFALYEKLAALNNVEGMYWLGVMYRDGEGIEQDYEKAYEWFSKAAEMGDTSAMDALHIFYYEGKGVAQDYQKSTEWLKKAADMGDTGAMNNLGAMYVLGRGVEKNRDKALEYFERAAAAGNATALSNIGGLYSSGTEKDERKAFEYYEKSALAGSTAGMCNLAYAYKTGQGIEQDFEKAYEWYKKAADAGSQAAQEELERLILGGYGITPEGKGTADNKVEVESSEKEDDKVAELASDSDEQFIEDELSPADIEDFLAASGNNTLAGIKAEDLYNSGDDRLSVMFDAKDGETLIHPCFVMLMATIQPEEWGNLKHQELFLETIIEGLVAIYEDQTEMENGKLPYDRKLGDRLSMGGAHTEEIMKDFDGITFPTLGNWRINDSTDVLLFACYDEKQNAYMEDNQYLLIRYKLEDGVTFCQIETDQEVVKEFLRVMFFETENQKDSEVVFPTVSEGELQILYPKDGMVIYPENGEFTVKWCWGDQLAGGNLKVYSKSGVVYENKQKALANTISRHFYKEEFTVGETYTFELTSGDQRDTVEFMITDDPMKASSPVSELRILHPRNGQIVEYSNNQNLSLHWYTHGIEEKTSIKLIDENGNMVMEEEGNTRYERVQVPDYVLQSGKEYIVSVSYGELREEVRFTAVEAEPDIADKPVARYPAQYEGKDNAVLVLADGYSRTFAEINRKKMEVSGKGFWYRYFDAESKTIMRPSILVLKPGVSALDPGNPKTFVLDMTFWLYIVSQVQKEGLKDEQRDYYLPYREGSIDHIYSDYGDMISLIYVNVHENNDVIVFGLIDHETGIPLEDSLYMLIRLLFADGSARLCLCTDQEVIKAYMETTEADVGQSIWLDYVQWLNDI